MSINGQNVIGAINASGSARVDVDQMIIHQAAPEMEKLFKRAHKQIKVRPEDPKVDQAKLENQVKKIEAEAAKGEAADQSRLERWLKTLAKMAPDIVEVMTASLAGPVAGFTVVFKKIVERAKAASVEA
jgi:DNA replicative helicase MCM subunit Mcm2 (Cdc46/Mcm family)